MTLNSIKTSNKENLLNFSKLKSGIYRIPCIPIEKHYVGVLTYVTRRLNNPKSKFKRGCHDNQIMQEDFLKFGFQQFHFQRLLFGTGLSKDKLETLETFILETLPPEKRYNAYPNSRIRGSFSNPFLGKKHTLEARQCQSLAKKGLPSTFSGFKQTDEVKKLISEENRGKSDRRKALYIDSIYYESVSEASEKFELSRRLIRERCHSKEERFKNSQWANLVPSL